MRFQILCFGIFLITAMLDDVVTKSLTQLRDTQQLPNNIRTRRSTEDDDVSSLIADLIRQGKRETAFLVYSQENEINQNELIDRIVSITYEKNALSKLADFILFELNDFDQISLWFSSTIQVMKTDKESNPLLNTLTMLYFGHSARRIGLLEGLLFEPNKEWNLELLTETISKSLMVGSRLAVAELAEYLVFDNKDAVITAAIQYPVLFDSIFKNFISTEVDLNNTNSKINLVERFRIIFEFIPHIPSLTTSIDALVYLNKIFNNLKPNFISMKEGVMLAYSVKKLEAKVESANDLSLNSKRKFSRLKNQIPIGIQKLVDDPYVFIYKIDETKRKFMSSVRRKDHLTRYSDTTDKCSLWVLESINNADQFRIKNQESGEYLYADNDQSLEEFPNKRSVFTHKLENGSDVINNHNLGDRLVWVVTPVIGTNANRFTVMNLHFKEYLDGHEEPKEYPWKSDEGNNVHTWKDKVDPPASVKDWVISLRGIPESQPEVRLVCFYDNYVTQEHGAGQFTPDNIDLSKCTHLVYKRASIDNVTNAMKIGNKQVDEGFKKIVTLKQKNPKLKVMIAIGGLEVEEYYSHLNSCQENIENLVKSVVDFLQQNKFDGIHFELQFLYSGDQMNGVTSLLKALHKAFKKNYLLSANIHVSSGYDIGSFNEVLDFIGLQAFNFHGPWDYQMITIKRSNSYMTSNINADYAVNKIIQQGFSPSKIILDIPFHGKTWEQSTEYSDGKPDGNIKNSGARNDRSSQSQMPYYEICKLVKNGEWERYQNPMENPHAFSPIISDQRTWVAYDDPTMVVFKANYILTKGLGGAYVIDVNQDDFRNNCGGGINPMLTAIAKTFGIIASY